MSYGRQYDGSWAEKNGEIIRDFYRHLKDSL